MKKSQCNYGRSRNVKFTIVDSCLAQTKYHSQINSLAGQLLRDVIGHENQSQHYPDHRYICLELSRRISTPNGFSYHTGIPHRRLPYVSSRQNGGAKKSRTLKSMAFTRIRMFQQV